MNVLRLPRSWAPPFARVYYGTTQRTALSSPAAAIYTGELSPESRIFQLRSLSTDAAPSTDTPLATNATFAKESSNESSTETIPRSSPSSIAAHLPYQVELSKSGNLPIYQKHLKSGVIELSYIRKVKGDRNALVQDLSKYLDIPLSAIRIKEPSGFLEVKGKRMAEIKEFLRSKGIVENYESRILNSTRTSFQKQPRHRRAPK
ncbi:hypothetical protein ABW20_dc0108737 [Dactylellina cionopaga]|nr:hypothetical protein ABW20_dc0108737 [Dactylellina cionopaga]